MERQTKTVRQLLAAKHSEVSGVISVTPSDTVLFALKLMREKDIGAVIVLDGRQLKGILSERDYAREVELEGRTAKDCLVQQIMTERTIFYARADGITLDLLAKEMKVTRERIRQICLAVASKLALASFVEDQ